MKLRLTEKGRDLARRIAEAQAHHQAICDELVSWQRREAEAAAVLKAVLAELDAKVPTDAD